MFRYLVLFLFLSAGSVSGQIQSKSSIPVRWNANKERKLDELLNYCHRNDSFNGSLSISVQGKVVYEKTLGCTDKKSEKQITENTSFYLASVSKQFTAMGILILKENGKIELSDKVKKYVPNLPERASEITIRHLLLHTSGIFDQGYYKLTQTKPNADNADVIERLSTPENYTLSPGEKFQYSNFGYTLLAEVIARVSQQPIEKFFQSKIFIPLGMKNTTTSNEIAMSHGSFAVGRNFLGKEVYRTLKVIGPGGIYSSINDLEKWNQALNENTLVSKETLASAFTNGKTNAGEIEIQLPNQKLGYGFGWIISLDKDNQFVQHDGRVEGFRSQIKKNKTKGYDYIIVVNNGQLTPLTELSKSIDKVLESGQLKLPKIPTFKLMKRELSKEDLSVAVKSILNDIQNSPNKYDISERSINQLGAHYYETEQFDRAAALFRTVTLLHPNSSRALNNLGESLYRAGQLEEAHQILRKSSKLDPSKISTKELIDKVVEDLKKRK